MAGTSVNVVCDTRCHARAHPYAAEQLDYVRTQFATFCVDADDLEARRMVAVAVGTHLMAADHGTRSRAEVLRAVVRLMQV